jgi:hypothetical protein
LDRLIVRYDFADFNHAAADAASGAAIKPVVLFPQRQRPWRFADAFMVAIASRNPYLIDANRSSA